MHSVCADSTESATDTVRIFGKGKQPDYIKQRQPPEFRRLALFAGNELRFCRSCSGRQENFLRALDIPAPVPTGQQSVYAGIQQFSQLVQEDEVWAGEPRLP